jgi:hypothetical protein
MGGGSIPSLQNGSSITLPALIMAASDQLTLLCQVAIDWTKLGASSVTFKANNPEGLLTSNAYPMTIKDNAANPTLSFMFERPDALTKVGATTFTIEIDAEIAGIWVPIASTSHCLYTVLHAPIDPWILESPPLAAAPWLEAVILATKWATGVSDDDACLGAIAQGFYATARLPEAAGSAPRFAYSDDASANYGSDSSYDRHANTVSIETFALRQCIERCVTGSGGRGQVPSAVYCGDCANFICLLGRLLGIPVRRLSISSLTEPSSFDVSNIVLIGSVSPTTTKFSVHVVATLPPAQGAKSKIYDACIGFKSATGITAAAPLELGDYLPKISGGRSLADFNICYDDGYSKIFTEPTLQYDYPHDYRSRQ